MRSACRPRTSPSRTTSIRRLSQRRTSKISPASSRCSATASTGTAWSTPRIPSITSGRSGSSCRCTSTALPTRPRCRLTGARAASACWQTKRSSRACASAAARRSSARKRASGCCASRNTQTGSSTIWTFPAWTTLSASRPSRKTGSAAPPAPRSPSRPTPKTISPSTRRV